MAVKYEYITKPESFLGFFKAINASVTDLILVPFIYFNYENPFPFMYLKPEKGTPFGRSYPYRPL